MITTAATDPMMLARHGEEPSTASGAEVVVQRCNAFLKSLRVLDLSGLEASDRSRVRPL